MVAQTASMRIQMKYAAPRISGEPLTPATTSLRATLCILIFGVIVSVRFKLDRDSHGVLMNEIEHFKAGGSAPTSAGAREIVENLSGFAYADLWGKNSVGARRAVGDTARSDA